MKFICLLFATFFFWTAKGPFPYKNYYKANPVKVFTTAKHTSERLTRDADLYFSDPSPIVERKVYVFLDDQHTFQKIIGIGGAITDASAEVYAGLTPSLQDEILKAYYDSVNGIGYTLARTNIQSCDFSSGSYTYVSDNDKDLKTFSVTHDEKYRIPLIKKAMTMAGGLTIYASPWSPPAWMKTNNSMLHGGKLLPEYMKSWATFYIKFIQEYEKRGIPIWGLTVQNEPMATQTWESCVYNAEDERDFIKNYLGPTLYENGMEDKKLIAWDHNRDLMYNRSKIILNDPAAAKYVWGIGYHWYETWTGGEMQFENERMVHETFPDKHLIFTEGCAESFNKSRMDNWSLGEKYGYSMIHDFNSGTVAWTDWNILLDENGGPNHAANYCFAPVHAFNGKKLHYTNAFYYIGQFSKFIRPGAVRINASSNRSDLLTTAFKNPNGSIAVVVMNPGDSAKDFDLLFNGKAVGAKSHPHSISTLVFNNNN